MFKMPNIKTAERILDFLKKQKKPLTPTTIHKKTGIEYRAVISSIKSLEKFGQLVTISDGRIILVSLKDTGDKNINHRGFKN